jgi:hypothetical protein
VRHTGHATFIGAGITVLKLWFDDAQKISSLQRYADLPALPVQANAPSYTNLRSYTGADREELTIASELTKLAGNVGTGRRRRRRTNESVFH